MIMLGLSIHPPGKALHYIQSNVPLWAVIHSMLSYRASLAILELETPLWQLTGPPSRPLISAPGMTLILNILCRLIKPKCLYIQMCLTNKLHIFSSLTLSICS